MHADRGCHPKASCSLDTHTFAHTPTHMCVPVSNKSIKRLSVWTPFLIGCVPMKLCQERV